MGEFRLFPVQASTLAPEVDHLLYFLLAITVFFTLLIFGAIFYFAIRYRRRSERELPHVAHTGYTLEILWSVIPFGLTMVMFTWGASIFFTASKPPNDAIQIYAVGKQWMWKLQHLEGQREINELHIPVGTPVRVTMASEDVIHSFCSRLPTSDVVPGRYTTTRRPPSRVPPLLRRIRYQSFWHDRLGIRHGAQHQTGSAAAPRRPAAENGKKLFEQLARSTATRKTTWPRSQPGRSFRRGR
jgi:cytochrome c oxidase subunit 2